MKYEEFIYYQVDRLENNCDIDHNDQEQIIKESIQFGRENPETCKVDDSINDGIFKCFSCGYKLLTFGEVPLKSMFNYCPYCGRKIIYEK